jgi:CheY-like chemotaxis protein
VAFTASGFEELAAQARAVGAVDVIFKPYRENELLEKIASLLKLALRYEGDEAIPTAPRSTSVPLASLLRVAPPPLRARLREAALQARVQRLESLATELEAFSSEAAVAVRELARDYRYDDLAAALAD